MKWLALLFVLAFQTVHAQYGTINPKIDADFELIGDNITHYEDMKFSHFDKGYGFYSIYRSDWQVKTNGETVVSMFLSVPQSSYENTMAAFRFYCSTYGKPIQKTENDLNLNYTWVGNRVKICFYFLTIVPESHSYIVNIDAI